LGKYLPEPVEGEHIIDFVGKIVDNIAKDRSPAYAEAIMLMAGYSSDKLNEFNTMQLFEIFSSGLIINNIEELMKFCKEINYGR